MITFINIVVKIYRMVIGGKSLYFNFSIIGSCFYFENETAYKLYDALKT